MHWKYIGLGMNEIQPSEEKNMSIKLGVEREEKTR